jgi:hypothetical protein
MAQSRGHSICFFFGSYMWFSQISNFFGLSTTEETWVVEMHIWFIKIGIVLVLNFNLWVEASTGGL